MSRRQLATTLLAAVLGGAITAAVLAAAADEGRTVDGGGLLASVASTAGPAPSMDELFLAAAPAVVLVQARTVQPGAFAGGADLSQEAVSAGSGFVLDEKGHVVTNAHVVSGVTQVEVTFSDPTVTVPARVVGKDEETDLAVLHVDPVGLDLRPLELGDSAAVREGDRALALANPTGYEATAGSGEVLDPAADIGTEDGAVLEDVIRTDAVILPASSGGPLLGADGRVIGIASRTQDATSFAVPADTAREVLEELETGHKVIRPYLGVQGRTADSVQGVLVESVYPGGPAAAAGVQPGDIVEEIDGEPVATLEALLDQVEARAPGDAMTLRISRGGIRSELPVKVAERPTTLPAER